MTKLYLTDPVMAWIGPRLCAGLPAPDMTRLTESAIAVALAAAVEARQPGRWATDEAIGFHRTRGGGKVDLAPVPLPTPTGDRITTPIEVKWVSHGWRSEARAIEANYGAGIVTRRKTSPTSATRAGHSRSACRPPPALTATAVLPVESFCRVGQVSRSSPPFPTKLHAWPTRNLGKIAEATYPSGRHLHDLGPDEALHLVACAGCRAHRSRMYRHAMTMAAPAMPADMAYC